MDIFKGFDFSPMVTHAGWLIFIYGFMLVCMTIDLICGIRKAKQSGTARTSRGYKKTCDKALKYFMPMLCLTCVDVMVSVIEPLPFLTMAMAAFNMWCEFKSIMENTHEKKEIRKAEKTMSIILENKDEIVSAMVKMLKDMEKDPDEKPEGIGE